MPSERLAELTGWVVACRLGVGGNGDRTVMSQTVDLSGNLPGEVSTGVTKISAVQRVVLRIKKDLLLEAKTGYLGHMFR